jgi:hypothetical protein
VLPCKYKPIHEAMAYMGMRKVRIGSCIVAMMIDWYLCCGPVSILYRRSAGRSGVGNSRVFLRSPLSFVTDYLWSKKIN